MAAGTATHRVPIVFPLEGDGRRHREKGGRVAGSLPLVALDERVSVGPAPADDERLDERLVLRPDVEERRALRRAEPLVAVAGVNVGVDRAEVNRNLTRRVRTVDDGKDPCLPRTPAQLGDGKCQRRRRGDMAEEEHLGSRRHPAPDRLDNLVQGGYRKGHRSADVTRPRPGTHVRPGHVERPVLVVGRQDLVVRLEGEGTGHDVQPRSGIGDEDEVVGASVEVGGEFSPCGVQERAAASPEELDRLPLQLQLPPLVRFEHRPRAGPEGAVVEKDHVRVEQKLVTEGARHTDGLISWAGAERASRRRGRLAEARWRTSQRTGS